MARNGKIARMPHWVREELNRRLHDGEQGKGLVSWLNGLPEVQLMLAREFGGDGVTKQNLSDWKSGGYCEWLARVDLMAEARAAAAESEEATEAVGDELTDHLATAVAMRYAAAMAQWNGEVTDGFRRKLRVLRELCRGIGRLRRGDYNSARLKLERERLEWERAFQCRMRSAEGGIKGILPAKGAKGDEMGGELRMARNEDKTSNSQHPTPNIERGIRERNGESPEGGRVPAKHAKGREMEQEIKKGDGSRVRSPHQDCVQSCPVKASPVKNSFAVESGGQGMEDLTADSAKKGEFLNAKYAKLPKKSPFRLTLPTFEVRVTCLHHSGSWPRVINPEVHFRGLTNWPGKL